MRSYLDEEGPQPTSLREWGELEDVRGEWVDGALVEEEEVGYLHDLVVAWLITELELWLRSRGGLVAASDARFGVSDRRGRKPDVSAYLAGTARPPARGLIEVPPTIAIEVVSPTPRDARRDRVEKLAEYAKFGVRFYWIVEPQARFVEIYELASDGRYVRAASAAEGMLEPPGCEGLVLNLDALWARADSLEDRS